jgi:pyruvate/2-oxoglutarate dehydrogenase complex dihydrolipoamide dehydrogenase (E3) component
VREGIVLILNARPLQVSRTESGKRVQFESRCTYTDPQVAHVGLSEATAQQQGIPLQTWMRPLTEVDRAVLDGEEEGFVKIIVRQGTDKILGATIVARLAGEMISEVTTAMAGKLGLGALAAVIHP